MKRCYYTQLKKKYKERMKNLDKYLIEYNEENGVDIDFYTFFVEVLCYSEEDYIKFSAYKEKCKKKVQNRRDNPKLKTINQEILIKKGIGDFENPEYIKYWKIFTEYNENYLGDTSITGKKTLKNYFILKHGYDEDKAYEESKKISKIIFKKNNHAKAAA